MLCQLINEYKRCPYTGILFIHKIMQQGIICKVNFTKEISNELSSYA